jgi:hypothetical protein
MIKKTEFVSMHNGVVHPTGPRFYSGRTHHVPLHIDTFGPQGIAAGPQMVYEADAPDVVHPQRPALPAASEIVLVITEVEGEFVAEAEVAIAA